MNFQQQIEEKIKQFIAELQKAYDEKIQELQKREQDLMEQTKIVRIAQKRMLELDTLEKNLKEKESLVEQREKADRDRKIVLELKEKEIKEKMNRAQNLLSSISSA